MNKVRPKKKFGQHFLINKEIAQRITDLLNKKSKHVLEIGPGMGILTQFLAKKKINLQLIEIDQESIAYIQKNYPTIKDKIILYDFLKFNIKDYYKKNLSIIGNFPYNISSQILFKVLRNKEIIIEVIGNFIYVPSFICFDLMIILIFLFCLIRSVQLNRPNRTDRIEPTEPTEPNRPNRTDRIEFPQIVLPTMWSPKVVGRDRSIGQVFDALIWQLFTGFSCTK